MSASKIVNTIDINMSSREWGKCLNSTQFFLQACKNSQRIWSLIIIDAEEEQQKDEIKKPFKLLTGKKLIIG